MPQIGIFQIYLILLYPCFSFLRIGREEKRRTELNIFDSVVSLLNFFTYRKREKRRTELNIFDSVVSLLLFFTYRKGREEKNRIKYI